MKQLAIRLGRQKTATKSLVMTHQAIGVFVLPPLPRAVRMSEVNLDARVLSQLGMLGKFARDTGTWPIQARRNGGRFKPLLELGLNQGTVSQGDVLVFFCHAAFFHERMLHLGLERAR